MEIKIPDPRISVAFYEIRGDGSTYYFNQHDMPAVPREGDFLDDGYELYRVERVVWHITMQQSVTVTIRKVDSEAGD